MEKFFALLIKCALLMFATAVGSACINILSGSSQVYYGGYYASGEAPVRVENPESLPTYVPLPTQVLSIWDGYMRVAVEGDTAHWVRTHPFYWPYTAGYGLNKDTMSMFTADTSIMMSWAQATPIIAGMKDSIRWLSNHSIFTEIDPVFAANGVMSTGSYANPSWITTLAYAKLTGTPTIPTNTNQLTNGSGFITGITSGNVTTALGYTPLAAEVDGSITNEIELPSQSGNSGKVLSTNGTIPSWVFTSSGTVTSVGLSSSDLSISGSPVTSSGSITANLNNSGVTAGSYKNVTVTAKGIVTGGSNLSYNNTPSRSIVTAAAAANGTQISSTRDAFAHYAVTINTTVSLTGNSTGYVVFEICSTNSSTASDWTEIDRASSGQSGTLVIGLVLTQIGGGHVGGLVPQGWYSRIRSVNTSGTPTYSYNSGQEVTY